jgi:hypothetical protein
LDNRTRFFAAACFFLLLIAAGLAAGFYLRPYLAQKMAQTTQATPAAVSSAPQKDSQNVYEISPPSRGPWIKVISVDIKPENDKARVSLSDEDSNNITVGQNVLLYDDAGMLMEILGRVENISKGPDGFSAEIALNGDDEFPSAPATRGEIVVQKENDAQRLPLSAVVEDRDGKSYVWEVTESEDGTMNARRVDANILDATTQFLVIAQPLGTSNVFILNPDNALRDGQVINARKKLFSGPPLAEDTRIEQAIIARTPLKPGDPYRGPEIIVPCEIEAQKRREQGAPQIAGNANRTCPASTEFMNKVKALSNTP